MSKRERQNLVIHDKSKAAKAITKRLRQQKDFLEEVLGWIASGEIKVADLPPVLVTNRGILSSRRVGRLA